jgi:hypothetical protein
MKLSAPKKATWWIATILAVVSILVRFVAIPVLTPHKYVILAVAFILLWLGTFIKGL